MKITADDYEVINRMCEDRSWHDRVNTREAHEKMVRFSSTIVRMFLLEVKMLHKHRHLRPGQPARKGGE